jgi:bifunctional non-homologous end joining protein LigD
MGTRRQSELQGWTPEPTYSKPDISVRATTLYYEIIAPLMLPYIEGRLLNLFRCRQDTCFFQRSRAHPPSGRDFKEPVRFEPIEQKNGRTEDYLYVTDADGIVACAKVQTVEFHGWGSRAGAVEMPDRVVIDLDPGDGVEFEQVKQAAVQIRRSFEAVKLKSFALLTGGKGIHVVVPIQPEAAWPEVRHFTKAFCTALADADPQRFTIALQKQQRHGRIFLDYLRNQRTATAILPYSARARDGAPVAAPVAWSELEKFGSSTPFAVADVAELLRRAKRKSVANWGFAEQRLPRFL